MNNQQGAGLAMIHFDHRDRNGQFDLKRFFYITPAGREYLSLRREFEDG